jgi:hypothetical protein
MTDMVEFCRSLEQTSIGAAVRESSWLFPAIETLHLLGMAALLATITFLDFCLLGLVKRRDRIADLAKCLLPWTWTAFAVQVITGTLLFLSEAVKVYTNPAFRLKMLLIVLAGFQALIFEKTTYRSLVEQDVDTQMPWGAKIAGCISILLWVSIVAAGRFIGFV